MIEIKKVERIYSHETMDENLIVFMKINLEQFRSHNNPENDLAHTIGKQILEQLTIYMLRGDHGNSFTLSNNK